MPIYEYRCARGHLSDAYRTVERRHDALACDTCGEQTEKIISRPAYAVGDIAGYRSVIDGSWIGSRSKHRAHLRDHGVIEVGNERLPERKHIPLGSPREDIRRAMETTS